MRILYSCVPFDGGRSGISVYMRNVLRELEAAGHELTLIAEPSAAGMLGGRNFILLPKWAEKPLFSMLYHLFVLPFILFFRRREWDFCIIGAANRRAFAFYPLFTVTVVHDLALYHVKAKYDRLRMCYLKTVLPFFIRRAPACVAISRSTAEDMEKFWRIQREKITVCYNGLSLPAEHDGGWPEKHGLADKNYILYVSRIEHPGKNHINLIRAYGMLPAALREKYRLVLAGADWHGAEKVHRFADGTAFTSGIVFTGFVGNDDLYSAYIHAACYVFPSFFEGFGLSLIEAMHYRVPCCCSDNSSLGEIGGGAALLFPPDDPAAIAAALEKILTDKAERERLIAAGVRRAAMFSWSDHAAEIVEIYRRHESGK
ncbi:MAG: glycosyltransferase family 1 protein [Victivallaceae bacterium]|nr:glycosyltransferase family 1 protein [Victivallaceae bacterium]